jgi:Flp pilus assembly protein TadB
MNKLVELPSELVSLLILVPVTFLVTEGLKALSNLIGRDISGAASYIVAGLVAAVMAFVNALLALIPAEYEPIVAAIFNLVVLLFGAAGLHRTVKRFG